MRKMIYLGVVTMVFATIGFISCEKEESKLVKEESSIVQDSEMTPKQCDECLAAVIDAVVGIVKNASLHRGTTDRPRDGVNCGYAQCFGMCWPNNTIGNDAFEEAANGEGYRIAISQQMDGNSVIYFLDELPDHFENEFGIDDEITVLKEGDILFTIEKGVYAAESQTGVLESDTYGDLNYSGYVIVSVK